MGSLIRPDQPVLQSSPYMLVPLNHRKRDLKSWCIRGAFSWKPLYSFAGLDCHKKCQRLGSLHYGNLFSQFRRLKSKMKVSAGWVSSGVPPWLVGGHLLHTHEALCAYTHGVSLYPNFLFLYGHHSAGFGPTHDFISPNYIFKGLTTK